MLVASAREILRGLTSTQDDDIGLFVCEQEGAMSEVVYTSKVRIERVKGPLRLAYLPGESQPVKFSVHGAIAEHYKIDPTTLGEAHAATLDYVIAATAG
jgi:hypothetical protein